MSVSNWAERPYDIIIFGATSFVGKLLVRYMLETYGTGQGLNWALAGRSESKLNALTGDLGVEAGALQSLIGDATDPAFLNDLASKTRVIVTTVGPYALYGNGMVEACVAQGTDYCDLTGEVQWINRMIARHHEAAQQSGARIVHTCGFDCIPADMGVHFLQSRAIEAFGQPAQSVKMNVHGFSGGVSGGTAASMVNVMKEMGEDPSLRSLMRDHYSLVPANAPARPRQPESAMLKKDDDSGAWTIPFIMAAVDTRVVHRTNALRGMPYGADFTYEEVMEVGEGLKGALAGMGSVAGSALFAGLAAFGPTRALLERFVLPKPGEGPSPEAQEKGYFDLRFYGSTAQGQIIKTKVTGDRDPGYGSTCKMLGESAMCLLRDVDRTTTGGGLFTPASAMGDALIERLTKNAGLTFERV